MQSAKAKLWKTMDNDPLSSTNKFQEKREGNERGIGDLKKKKRGGAYKLKAT